MPKRKWSKGIDIEENELTKHGWRKKNKASTRRNALKQSVKEDGYATTIRRLNVIINLTKDKSTKRKMKSDMKWLQNQRAKALSTGRGILAEGTKGRHRPQRRISR